MPTTSSEGMIAAPPPAPAEAVNALPIDYSSGHRASSFRWVILGLVFFAITINYIDRIVIMILAPDLKKLYQITDNDYGHIMSAFALCYAIGQMVSGRWLDWIGTRVGYAIALAAWSGAAILHALARTATGFGIARGLLGVTESPAYPAAVKTLAEWFPKKERALAMGFANAGANVGAVLAPLIVPWLAVNFGWQSAFVVTGAIGLIWLVFWIPLYRKPTDHPRVSADELAYIHSDPPEPTGKVRWILLLTYPQTWGFVLGKFLTDPVWSFYLFWSAIFFAAKHKTDLKSIGLPLVVIYVMADIGSIAGGWLSSTLIKRGWSVNGARKLALLVNAVAVVPVIYAAITPHKWTAVLLFGLAVSAHQGFSSNLYTLVSDTFPKRAVGSVAGLGGTFGYLGTTIFMTVTGKILSVTNNNYLPILVVCGSAYLLALLIIHLTMPRLEPATIDATR
jgi:ACS family hexuronate transporter-like MFS transporter